MSKNKLRLVVPSFYKRLHDRYLSDLIKSTVNSPDSIKAAATNYFMVNSTHLYLGYVNVLYSTATTSSYNKGQITFEQVEEALKEAYGDFSIDMDFSLELESQISEVLGDDKITPTYTNINIPVEKLIDRYLEEVSREENIEYMVGIANLINQLGYVSFNYDVLLEKLTSNSTNYVPNSIDLMCYTIDDFSNVKSLLVTDVIDKVGVEELATQWDFELSGYVTDIGRWFAVIETQNGVVVTTDPDKVLTTNRTILDNYLSIDIFILDV